MRVRIGNILSNILCSDHSKHDVHIILYLFRELNRINLPLNFLKYFLKIKLSSLSLYIHVEAKRIHLCKKKIKCFMFIFCARKTHIHLIVLLFLYNLIQKENYFTPGLITVLQKVKLLQLLAWFFLQKFSLCVKVLGNSCARF